MSYDVSVIIPAYRAENFIARAVTSLARQGPIDIQAVICADDEADYLAILEAAGVDTEHAVQCRTERPGSGPAAARNAALRMAGADIIAPLDADDEFVEGRLPALIGAVGQSGAATGPTAEFRDGEVTRMATSSTGNSLGVDDICRLRMPFPPVFRKGLAGSGWPDVRYAEDVIFNVELCLRATRYAFVNEAIYVYHLHPGSLTNDGSTMARALEGYHDILDYAETADWPEEVRRTVREVFREDIAMVKAVAAGGIAPGAGTWRDAWAGAQKVARES